MAHLFIPTEATRLYLQLSDGAENQYPQAMVFDGTTLDAVIPLSHVSGGLYSALWVPSGAVIFEIRYTCYHDPTHTIPSLIYEQVTEKWQPTDMVSEQTAEALLDTPLTGHGSAGSVGEALARLALIEKIQRNRLELAEGATNNWILYDDDSITPLLRWSVTDKTGLDIRMNAFVPARRTRGV